MDCKIQLNLTQLVGSRKLATDIENNFEINIQADTNEEFAQKLGVELSKLQSKVQAYMELSMGGVGIVKPINKETWEQEISITKAKQADFIKDQILSVLNNTENLELNLKAVLSNILLFKPYKDGDKNIQKKDIEGILERFKSKRPSNKEEFETWQTTEEGTIWSEALSEFIIGLSKVYVGQLISKKEKDNLINQIQIAKNILGLENINVFPEYVQLVTSGENPVAKNSINNIFFIEGADELKVLNPLNDEITLGLIQFNVKNNPNGVGVAKPRMEGNILVYDLYVRKQGEKDILVDSKPASELYKPNQEGNRSNFSNQVMFRNEIDSFNRPVTGNKNTKVTPHDNLNVRISDTISVVTNKLMHQQAKDQQELFNGLSTLPVFTHGRETILRTVTQTLQPTEDGYELSSKLKKFFITKGLNTKIDAVVLDDNNIAFEIDTLNYYYVDNNKVLILDFTKEASIRQVVEAMNELGANIDTNLPTNKLIDYIFDTEFAVLAREFKVEGMDLNNKVEIPMGTLKTLDETQYRAFRDSFSTKIEVINHVTEEYEKTNKITNISLKDLGFSEFKVIAYDNNDFEKKTIESLKPLSTLDDNKVQIIALTKEEQNGTFVTKYYKQTATGYLDVSEEEKTQIVKSKNLSTSARNNFNTKGIKLVIVDNNSYVEQTINPEQIEFDNQDKITAKFTALSDMFVSLTKATVNKKEGYTGKLKFEPNEIFTKDDINLISKHTNIFDIFLPNFNPKEAQVELGKALTYSIKANYLAHKDKLDNLSDSAKAFFEKSLVNKPKTPYTLFEGFNDLKFYKDVSIDNVGEFNTLIDQENPVRKQVQYKFEKPQPKAEELEEIVEYDDADFYTNLNSEFEGDRPLENTNYLVEALGLSDVRELGELGEALSLPNAQVKAAALNDKVYVGKETTQGIFYHEVFHIAFDGFFTQIEREDLLREAQQVFNYTKEDVYFYAQSIGKTGSYQELERTYLVEQLADSNAQWKLDRDNSLWRQYLGNAIVDFFEKLWKLISANKTGKLEEAFKLINSGKLKSRSFTKSGVTWYASNVIRNKNNNPISEKEFKTLVAQTVAFVLDDTNSANSNKYLDGLRNLNRTQKHEVVRTMLSSFQSDLNKIERYNDNLSFEASLPDAETYSISYPLTNRTLSFFLEEGAVETNLDLLVDGVLKVVDDYSSEKIEKERIDKQGGVSDEEADQTENVLDSSDDIEEEFNDTITRALGDATYSIDPTFVNRALRLILEKMYSLETIEIFVDGKIETIKTYRPINIKELISKIQKDFGNIVRDPNISSKEFFWKYIEEFAKYDKDYRILLNNLQREFKAKRDPVTKQLVVGRKPDLFNNIIKSMVLSQYSYAKVFVQPAKIGSLKTIGEELKFTDAFTDENGVDFLFDEDGNNNIFMQLVSPKVPLINRRSSITTATTKYMKYDGIWHKEVKEKKVVNGKDVISVTRKKLSDQERGKLYAEYKKDKASKEDRIKFVVSQLKAIKVAEDSSQTFKNVKDKVWFHVELFELLGMPITTSFAYLLSVDSRSFDKIEKLTTSIIATIEANKTLTVKEPLKSEESLEFILAVKKLGGFQYTSSVSNAQGKTIFTLSQPHILNSLEEFNPNQPIKFSSDSMMNLTFKDTQAVDFSELNKAQRLLFHISAWNKGMINLGQLESNKTNFSVVTKRDGVKDDIKAIYQEVINGIKTNYNRVKLLEKELNDKIVGLNAQAIYELAEEAERHGYKGVNQPVFKKQENGDYLILDGKLELDVSTFFGKTVNPGFSMFFEILPTFNGEKLELTKYNIEEHIKSLGEYTDEMFNKDYGTLEQEAKAWAMQSGQTITDHYKNLNYLQKDETDNYISFYQTDAARKQLEAMYISYIVGKHEANKKIVGKQYWMSFANSNSDTLKRFKSLAAFGQRIRKHNLLISKDDIHYVVEFKKDKQELRASNDKTRSNREPLSFSSIDYKSFRSMEDLKEFYIQYGLEYTESGNSKFIGGKEVTITKVETSDGQSVSTMLHRFDTIEDKHKLSSTAVQYYSYLMTGGLGYLTTVNGELTLTIENFEDVLEEAQSESIVNGGFKSVTANKHTASNNVGTHQDLDLLELFLYEKQSEYAPEKALYARIRKTNHEQAKVLYLELFNLLFEPDFSRKPYDKAEVSKLYEQINRLYEAIPGQETLFNLMTSMENRGIDMNVRESGSKTAKAVSSIDNPSIIEVAEGSKKHLTELPNNHDTVTLSSQMMIYALLNQNKAIVSHTVNGVPVYMDQVIKDYQRALSDIIKHKTEVIDSLLKGEDKDVQNLVRAMLVDFVDSQRGKEAVKEYFEIENGSIKVLASLPQTAPIAAGLFIDIFNKIVNTKINGDSYVLLASSLYNLNVDKDGRGVMLSQLKDRKDTKSRPLQSFIEVEINGEWVTYNGLDVDTDYPNNNIREVHEIVIPAHADWMKEYLEDSKTLTQKQLDKKYDKELFYMASTRIPCENKRSMAVVKIVDFLPHYTGSVAITTTVMMGQTGHDHDADKLYTYALKARKIKTENGVKWVVAKTPKPEVAKKINKQNFAKNARFKNFIKEELYANKAYNDELFNLSTSKELVFKTYGKDAIRELNQYIKDDYQDDIIIEKYGKIGEAYVNSKYRVEEIKNETTSLFYLNYENQNLANTDTLDAIENRAVQNLMYLISNKHTLDSGLNREKTDIDFIDEFSPITDAQKTARTPFLTINNDTSQQALSTDLESAIGISADATKKFAVLQLLGHEFAEPFTVSLNNVSFSSSSFNELELFEKDEVKKLIEEATNTLNLAYGTSISISDNPDKFKSQLMAIWISVSTDAVKKEAASKINLNTTTINLYMILTSLGFPKVVSMIIATHPTIVKATRGKTAQEALDILSSMGEGSNNLNLADVIATHKDPSNTQNSDIAGFVRSLLITQKKLSDFRELVVINKGKGDIALVNNLVPLANRIKGRDTDSLSGKSFSGAIYDRVLENYGLIDGHLDAVDLVVTKLNKYGLIDSSSSELFKTYLLNPTPKSVRVLRTLIETSGMIDNISPNVIAETINKKERVFGMVLKFFKVGNEEEGEFSHPIIDSFVKGSFFMPKNNDKRAKETMELLDTIVLKIEQKIRDIQSDLSLKIDVEINTEQLNSSYLLRKAFINQLRVDMVINGFGNPTAFSSYLSGYALNWFLENQGKLERKSNVEFTQFLMNERFDSGIPTVYGVVRKDVLVVPVYNSEAPVPPVVMFNLKLYQLETSGQSNIYRESSFKKNPLNYVGASTTNTITGERYGNLLYIEIDKNTQISKGLSNYIETINGVKIEFVATEPFVQKLDKNYLVYKLVQRNIENKFTLITPRSDNSGEKFFRARSKDTLSELVTDHLSLGTYDGSALLVKYGVNFQLDFGTTTDLNTLEEGELNDTTQNTTTQEQPVFEFNEGQKEAILKFDSFLKLNKDKSNLNNSSFLLKGRGGTGKTTVAPALMELAYNKGYTIYATAISDAATTNLAKMASSNTNIKIVVNNFSSMFGLVPQYDKEGKLLGFDFPSGKSYSSAFPKIEDSPKSLLVFDEASMVSLDVIDKIKKVAPSITILYIGDNAQINPIGENGISSVFKLDNQHELTEVMRQAKTSPILDIASKLALEVDSIDFKSTGELSKVEDVIYRDFNSTTNQGVLVTNTEEFLNQAIEDFKNYGNKQTVVITGNNDNVATLNQKIRNKLVDSKEVIIEGEKLMTYSKFIQFLGKGKKLEIYNSSVINVEKVEKTLIDNIPVYKIVAEYTTPQGELAFVQMNVIHKSETEVVDLYYKQKEALFAKYGATQDQTLLPLMNEYSSTVLVDYGYAMTAHKVQGQTVRNSYVVPIYRGFSSIEARRMFYTSITRASDKLVIFGVSNVKFQTNNNKSQDTTTQIDFQEEQSSGYIERTKKNASADATIDFGLNQVGEAWTKKAVDNNGKKYIGINTNNLTITDDVVNNIVNSLNSVNAQTLNIAGMGIYNMAQNSQEQIDNYVYELLNQVLSSPNLKTKIKSIRTGGQTGFDEAGAKASIKLNIPTLVLAPKGWIFRNADNKDVYNEQQFKNRFTIQEVTSKTTIPKTNSLLPLTTLEQIEKDGELNTDSPLFECGTGF